MACETETCPPSGSIRVPRGDGITLIFSVRENNCEGDLFDISDAIEIVFIVADSLGGTVRIEKRLSDMDIDISTNGYEFTTVLDSNDTDALTKQSNYFECRITTAAGVNKTVVSGVFKSPDTMIKDIA